MPHCLVRASAGRGTCLGRAGVEVACVACDGAGDGADGEACVDGRWRRRVPAVLLLEGPGLGSMPSWTSCVKMPAEVSYGTPSAQVEVARQGPAEAGFVRISERSGVL